MRNAALLIVLLVPSLAAAARPERGSRDASSACGVEILPLVEGNTWSWQSLDDTVTVTIKKITAGDPTIFEVEEKLADRTLALTWTCTDEGLVVPPGSFLWLGEPGGGVGMELEVSKHEGVSFPVK